MLPRPLAAVVAVLALLAACARPAPHAPHATAPALRLAASFDYPPFSVETPDGARRGLDVAVLSRLAGDLGMRAEWMRLAWPALDAATAAARFDVAGGGITMRPERALLGRYTRPYAVTAAIPLVRRAADGRHPTPASLDQPGVRLAVNTGGHLERVARQRFARATIVPVADNRIFAALADGRADAVLTDTAEWHAHGDAGELVALAPLTHDDKAYLLPADRSALAARIDDWLAAREADGWLDAERVRWLGAGASMDAAAAGREAVAALVRLRLGLMPDVAAAKRAVGLPIEDRVQEARVLERVRAQVPSDPDRAAAVYAELIEMAKAVQRDTPPRRGDGPALDTLRAALGRIDETLGRELGRLPGASDAAWQATLRPVLSGAGASPAAIDRLAAALATPAAD